MSRGGVGFVNELWEWRWQRDELGRECEKEFRSPGRVLLYTHEVRIMVSVIMIRVWIITSQNGRGIGWWGCVCGLNKHVL